MSDHTSTTQPLTRTPGALPADHPPVKFGRTGVLLINLGTPDDTDFWSVRRYLREFLSDRRVIEVNPVAWQLILNLIILTFRPAKAAKAYKKIWLKEGNESPLRAITRHQAEAVQRLFQSSDDPAETGTSEVGTSEVVVEWAMRYGSPSIKSRILSLQAAGCDRLVIFPLYPQYSATTTATVCDAVFRVMLKLRWQPTLRFVPPYHDHEAFIEALAQSYRDHLKTLDWTPEKVVVSFHGLPEEYLHKGDPYHCHCYKTARLLRDKLGMTPDELQLGFQSRFGPAKWLQPYVDELLPELVQQQGLKRVVVLTPGFQADCVETLEEIDIELKETFVEAGGTHFSRVPALNDSEGGIKLLKQLCDDSLAGGW